MKRIEAFLARHERVALQFSSGKDSAACLWLLEPYWDRIDVIWSNPGNPYPETLAYMDRIAKLVPHFKCVLGQQPSDIDAKGWPVDVLPLANTPQGMALAHEPAVLLRPFWECCLANMWGPLQDEVIRGGYTGVIRGQKQADRLKNPMPSGSVVDGIEYLYPIDDWPNVQVFKFLGDRVPESYKRGLKSSLDCINCTAYTMENPGRIGELADIDHFAWKQVSLVHLHLTERLAAQSEFLEKCHGRPVHTSV